jgi:dTDP-glucose pyrophosphorylase
MNKAVILAAGLGTRMRKADAALAADALSEQQAAIAATGVKALMPIEGSGASRPFLDYVLSALIEAGYAEACLVIGPDHHALRQYYEPLSKPGFRIRFAVQAKPLGTANAVHAAEAFVSNDHFLMINSDNYYPPAAVGRLRAIEGNGVALFHRDAMLKRSNIEPDRIQKFAAAELDASGNMRRVLEKPTPEVLAALGDEVYLSMNCWRFGPSVFEACRNIKPSPRGEYEVTDAAQYVIDVLKEPFRAVLLHEPVLDMSNRADIGGMADRLKHQALHI